MATQKKMSNVNFVVGIEGVSRKFARRMDTAVNKLYTPGLAGLRVSDATKVIPGVSYFGNMSRSVNVFGIGNVTRNNFFVRKPYNAKAATQAQIEVRENLTAAKRWVDAAMKDLTSITQNQQTFLTCRDDFSKKVWGVSVFGYQSMTGWMMGCAMAKLKSGGELPTNHLLTIDV